MSKIEVREYLGAYAWGTLTPAEERALHEAALDDPELFNALAEEALLREALTDEEFRRRLKRRLAELNRDEAARAVVPYLTGWIRRPALVLGCALAVFGLTVSFVLLFEPGTPGGPAKGLEPAVQSSQTKDLSSVTEPKGASRIQEGSLERLWKLGATGRKGGVDLELNRPGAAPRYEVGRRMRVEFSVPEDAVVVVLAKTPGGAVTRWFPNNRQPSGYVRASERVMVPRAGQGDLRVEGPPGRYRVRLLAFPPGSDLGDAISMGRKRPLVAERQYQVLRRRRGAE